MMKSVKACSVFPLMVYLLITCGAQELSPTDYEELCVRTLRSDEIVGGRETSIEAHPYQASFIVNGNTFCGGFIISPNFVMTAAHCVQRATSPQSIQLRVGSTFRDAGGIIVPVAGIVFHAQFDKPEYDNDIAVIRLAQPLEFNANVSSVMLPPRGASVPSAAVTVTGWGLTMQDGTEVPRMMMEVTVPTIWDALCRASYGPIYTERMFCAGHYLIGGRSSCQGDSGGPVVFNGTAIGIVSYARGCALPLSPTVFTNIAAMRDWITNQTGI